MTRMPSLLLFAALAALVEVGGFGVAPAFYHHSPAACYQSSTILSMAMPKLPDNVEKYTQVPTLEPVFTATTIPVGLQKDHTTKPGVWGVIKVLQGKLEYMLDGSESFELSPNLLGIVEPERKHHVSALSDDLEFVVEFHRETRND